MAKEPWPLAGKARNDLADLVESLSEEQMATPNVCGVWSPKDILGHVLFTAEMKMLPFMMAMAKAGFNYDKMANRASQKLADENSTAALVARLRAAATRPSPAPGFTEMIPVGDCAIHTQDIRRGLELAGKPDDAILATALKFLTTHKIGKDLSDVGEDVRFEATDLDWSHGDGPVASGPAEAIMMTLAGRAKGELTGDGAANL